MPIRPLLRRALTLAAVSGLLLALAALPALAAEVTIDERGFSPAVVRVEVGESIVWVNATADGQTVVGEDGTWDSGPLAPGETFSIAFREEGTFRYATVDGDRLGTVEVRAAAPAAADAGDGTAEQAAAPALPHSGSAALRTLGWALVLLGAGGALVLGGRRATA